MAINPEFWRGRRVFLTGHTGFKGSWLALWLGALGARVSGFALAAPTNPSLFAIAGVEHALERNEIGDIRDRDHLASAFRESDPEIVFHFAAQSLVRASYADPLATYATNVMGTVHLLEAVRTTKDVRVVVNLTSDKCYENREDGSAYRETDAMGGHDPYSSSKGAAEIITSAYRRSFFANGKTALASARAGNVIGGGDWAADRLIPDFFRAFDAGLPLAIRSPAAVRPWQHVLEPLAGYLLLAEHMYNYPEAFAEGWNFGPDAGDARTVSFVANYLADRLDGRVNLDPAPQPHEAGLLHLDSSKARSRLGWQPKLPVTDALDSTAAWHAAWRAGADMRNFTLDQIAAYAARKA